MTIMSTHISLLFISFCFLLQLGLSALDFHAGGQVTIHIPPVYQPGFTGRALVLEAISLQPPGFSAAVSVEASNGRYLCSLIVLLGDMKVWASDHFAKFAPARSCTLELTEDGELRLTDGPGLVGWRSATAMQGVKRLHLEPSTGNLILVDAKNQTIWQSFDYPTDTILWGQRLDVPSYLTAFPANLSAFYYSFEINQDKIITYLNFRYCKYSYWELNPQHNRTIAFAKLGTRGLKFFDGHSQKIAQISLVVAKPVRFMAVGHDGNLGMYHYSPRRRKFRAAHKALGFCDLPLSCGLYGICSSTGACEHVRLPRTLDGVTARFEQAQYSSLCDAFGPEVAMVELKGIVTVLRTSPLLNVTVKECVDLCSRSCSCAAALYLDTSNNESNISNTSCGVCSHYGIMAGAREVESASGVSYWVKVPKGVGSRDDDGISTDLVAKILIIGGVIDVMALFVVVGGLVYYFLHVHKSNDMCETNNH